MAGPFVDRIEGDVAVLVEAGTERKVKLAKLPQGVREGVYLTADLKAIDEAAGDETLQEIQERRKRLEEKGGGGGDFSL